MWKRKNIYILLAMGLWLVLGSPAAWAQLTINVIAVNASEKDFKEQEIKYYLPKELEPEDVLDAGDLKVDYDVDKASYYAYGKFQFNPKETKTFKIRVKDVWTIKKEEISILKKQLEESLNLMEKDKTKADLFPKAQKARDKIFQQLDYILAQQQNYSENIDRRIEEYRAYKAQMLAIKDRVFDENYLASEAPAEIDNQTDKTVKFIIQVKNPSAEKEKLVVHKHYLPEEVRAENVVDSKDFQVRFDEEKGRAYLTKEENFKPGEEKTYEIVIKDIWNFPTKKIDPILQRTTIAADELKTTEYSESSQFLVERIQLKLKQVQNSQKDNLTIKQTIGLYRVNDKRFTEAKDDLDKLEKMVAIMRMKQLEEMQKGKVTNVLQKLKALRGLAQLSEAIFKKGISVTVTWRIIFGTLLFVGLFTAMHFMIWARRSKTMGEEQGPKASEGVKVVPKPGEGGAAVEPT